MPQLFHEHSPNLLLILNFWNDLRFRSNPKNSL